MAYHPSGVVALFSAHAEVFPSAYERKTRNVPLLRARGGISSAPQGGFSGADSSPRTRRYFLSQLADALLEVLFSAHAEVFPSPVKSARPKFTLLRARGGISYQEQGGEFSPVSSPRTRRYFRGTPRHRPRYYLFSAHAEVFPHCLWLGSAKTALLRARGGISSKPPHKHPPCPSSPRTRRYFEGCEGLGALVELFSAHAEVFPSPHQWTVAARLFSAHAEVFPLRRKWPRWA